MCFIIGCQYHEKLDGSCYPHGLKGDEMCLEARIFIVSDII
ncbi:HD domain-containing phosphohydrolase [Sulfuricurvum sp.]